jgi:hypothetical protein
MWYDDVRREDNMTRPQNGPACWGPQGGPQQGCIYKIGGIAALGAVLVGVLEILITFLPGGNVPLETVLDWFTLFHENAFMGLRNLGLLNILLNALAILIFFALWAAHRQSPDRPYATLAALIAMLGVAVFFATNRAFAMWDLSNRYAAATTDAQRAAIETAGFVVLSTGRSHSPGTFWGFFLLEAAGVMMSAVMLHSGIFSKAAAVAGLLGFGMLAFFEVISSFVLGLDDVTMILAMFGGLLVMAWYVLIAARLFQLGNESAI